MKLLRFKLLLLLLGCHLLILLVLSEVQILRFLRNRTKFTRRKLCEDGLEVCVRFDHFQNDLLVQIFGDFPQNWLVEVRAQL